MLLGEIVAPFIVSPVIDDGVLVLSVRLPLLMLTGPAGVNVPLDVTLAPAIDVVPAAPAEIAEAAPSVRVPPVNAIVVPAEDVY
jgi:hypothetical protein